MTTLPLSVFIITKNEADRVPRALKSVVDWVDDVVVVDCGSTDDTVGVAKSLGARVEHRDWTGFGAQKRFGETQCQHDWILNIDADEWVSDELRDEIVAMFDQPQQHLDGYGGFWIPLADIPHFTDRAHRFGKCKRYLRLYNKTQGRFHDSPVHDVVVLESGRAGQLKAQLVHRSCRSTTHAIAKMNDYTDSLAEEAQKKGRRASKFGVFVSGPVAFWRMYVGRRYFLYGFDGYVFSRLYAYSRFAKYLKLYENQSSH